MGTQARRPSWTLWPSCLLPSAARHAHACPPFHHCSLTAGFLAVAPTSCVLTLTSTVLKLFWTRACSPPSRSSCSHSIDPDWWLWFTLMSSISDPFALSSHSVLVWLALDWLRFACGWLWVLLPCLTCSRSLFSHSWHPLPEDLSPGLSTSSPFHSRTYTLSHSLDRACFFHHSLSPSLWLALSLLAQTFDSCSCLSSGLSLSVTHAKYRGRKGRLCLGD